jgi:hypothetical protein
VWWPLGIVIKWMLMCALWEQINILVFKTATKSYLMWFYFSLSIAFHSSRWNAANEHFRILMWLFYVSCCNCDWRAIKSCKWIQQHFKFKTRLNAWVNGMVANDWPTLRWKFKNPLVQVEKKISFDSRHSLWFERCQSNQSPAIIQFNFSSLPWGFPSLWK